MATTWTSGALSTDNQYVKYTISITQNSQSIANNTSKVTVKVRFYRTNTGYETYNTGTVYCKINGTTYKSSVTTSQKITSSGIVLFTKTLNISHASNGSKTLTCSAWIDLGSVLQSDEQSYSHALTTIPRKSIMTVDNGTLNVSQNLTITRKSTSFTHTIKYTCGSASGTICTKSSSTTVSFTPPATLAKQNTTGVSLTIKYTITTYNGSTDIGSNSYTKTLTIPNNDTFKPSAPSITVSDYGNYTFTDGTTNTCFGKFGCYVRSKSNLSVRISASAKQNATIVNYKSTFQSGTYTNSSFKTGYISSASDARVYATVTDSRGLSNTASTAVLDIRDYRAPKLSRLSVKRCNSDGTINASGEYLKAIFDSTVSAINDKNKAEYVVKWKKSTDAAYSSENQETLTIAADENKYVLEDKSFVFLADTLSSYDVTVEVTDYFQTDSINGSGPSTSKTFSIRPEGKGIAFGKVADTNDLFEVQWPAQFNDHVTNPNNKYLRTYMSDGASVVNLIGRSSSDNIWVGEQNNDSQASIYMCVGPDDYLFLNRSGNGNVLVMDRGIYGATLWSGSWSSGSITVPNTNRYWIYRIGMDNQGTAVIGVRYGSHIRGLGGNASTANYTVFLACTYSGDTWTYSKCHYLNHTTGNNSAELTIVNIVGLV